MRDLLDHCILEADILVAGGGPAGVACAIGAARQGATVILMQDRPMLGGNASSEIRMHILGADNGRASEDCRNEMRETGVIEEIRLENAFRNPQRSPSMFDQILYEKCKGEPNLSLYLDTRVIATQAENGVVTQAQALNASTETRYSVKAKVFIDCTGDGGLAASAGAAFMRGREDQQAHGEPHAQEFADHKTLGSTLLLMGRKHERPMRFIPPDWARKFTEDDLKHRVHASPDSMDYGLEYGFWWLEWGGQLDTIKDNEAIRHELLSIVMGVWDHIKNGGDHGADHWALDWFGAVPGKRESRRFIGQHILTENDVIQAVGHPDTIAYGGWAIDLHPPEGVDKPEEHPCTQIRVPFPYDIPLGCCVARDFSNLLFAGRNLSATHVAFASTRIMATCATVGEALGISAAFAVKKKVAPALLPQDPALMAELQQHILAQDLFLINQRYNGTEDDLAPKAKVTASSQQGATAEEGAPEAVLSGVNRAIAEGLPEERRHLGAHRWLGAKGELPAWLELRWETPVAPETITLTFDTGLHRKLTLSQSNGYYRNVVWGTGQPELVKQYRVEVQTTDGQWQPVAQVQENWQRRRSHALPTGLAEVSAIRIVIEGTWGLDHARIVQVQVKERQA